MCWDLCGIGVSGFLPRSVCAVGVDSNVVIGCFDIIAQSVEKETVIVIDNAPIHRSEEFAEQNRRVGKTWFESIFSADLLSDTKQNRNVMGKDKI